MICHNNCHLLLAKEFRLLGYSADPQITITQDAPLDLQVNGLVAS